MLNVGTPGRNGDFVAFYGEAQLQQVANHFFTRNVGAQQSVDFFGFQHQLSCFMLVGHYVNNAFHNFANTQQFNQLACALYCGQGVFYVQTLFEACGCVGAHTQSGSSTTGGGAVEVCGFEQNHCGVANDFGIFTALDACNSNGLVFVSNYQHVGSQFSGYTFDGGQSFAFLCTTYDDVTAVNAAEVECVHGLTQFQHNIVGNVNDVVDGAHACCAQTFTHPQRRGANLNVLYQTSSVAGAQVCVDNGNGSVVVDIAACFCLNNGLVEHERLVEGNSSFSCQTLHAQAVGTVGSDFEFYQAVISADDGLDVLTGGQITGQFGVIAENQNAVFDGIGEIVNGYVQFLYGAQHTVGLFATELALGDVNAAGQIGVVLSNGNIVADLNVLCTGNDLNRFFFANVNLANPHMVGVFVALDFLNQAYHNILNFCTGIGGDFYLGAGNGHCLGKVMSAHFGHGQVDKFIQPFSGKQHILSVSFL